MSGRRALLAGALLGCAAAGLSQVGALRDLLNTTGRMHGWYHLALFAALGALAVRGSTRAWPRLGWLAAAMLLGLAMEWGETIRDTYPVEWVDVWTDFAGVALGGAAGWLLGREWRGPA